MGCNHGEHCLCSIVRRIAQAQSRSADTPRNPNENPGFLPSTIRLNTIPIMLLCKGTCDFFIGKGVFRDPDSMIFECFKTPFFRVNKFLDSDDDCCVQLELLQAQSEDGRISPATENDDVCNFLSSGNISRFIRTGVCITVDLNCFCGIECLPPVFAECEEPISISPIEEIITEEICGNFKAGEVKVWKAAFSDDFLEGRFQIFNDNTSLGNVTATIKADPTVTFPPVPPGFTVTREANRPRSFTISAPPGTSGRFCITLLKRVRV